MMETSYRAAVPRLDLVVLSADRKIEHSIQSLIERRAKALGIRRPMVEYVTHPNHDPGCLRSADKLLAVFRGRATHSLVVFDHEGSGREEQPREELERAVESLLEASGWKNCSAAIAIAPELEAWVWNDSPHVGAALGWRGRTPLRAWLVREGLLAAGAAKPSRPKEAVEAVLRHARKQLSSSIYSDIAARVGLDRCVDPAFNKLRRILRAWFAS
jgi:hypothetical protein